jgi:hypothetical protein
VRGGEVLEPAWWLAGEICHVGGGVVVVAVADRDVEVGGGRARFSGSLAAAQRAASCSAVRLMCRMVRLVISLRIAATCG